MESIEKKWTGGALLDGYNATFPFATLSVKDEHLILDVLFGGKFKFKPDQVINISKYGFIPFWMTGIRIHHNIPTYPDCVVYWHLRWSSKGLLEELAEYGFKTQY